MWSTSAYPTTYVTSTAMTTSTTFSRFMIRRMLCPVGSVAPATGRDGARPDVLVDPLRQRRGPGPDLADPVDHGRLVHPGGSLVFLHDHGTLPAQQLLARMVLGVPG